MSSAGDSNVASSRDQARTPAERHRILRRVRALLAMAESSEFSAEAGAFATKAQRLVDQHGIEAPLLRFPRESLAVAVIVAELQRLQTSLEGYGESGEWWATRTAEWSSCLDEYDMVLEAAAEMLQLPVPRLPYGARRHFRPEERAQIEQMTIRKITSS